MINTLKLTLVKVTIPALLLLVLFTKKLSSSTISNVVNYNKELALSNDQFEILVVKTLKLDSMRNYYKYDAKIVNDFQYQTLKEVITQVQIDKYLELKNYSLAMSTANNDWNDLQKYQLVANLDSIKTLKDIFEYRLKLLVATDRANYYKTQENVFAQNYLNLNKPEILERLFEIKKEKEKEKADIIRF